ncbi:unnamed protein product [Cylindrotheca closterium]|uniref:RxLR effector protein n=1 Tax=Cylindrotheca closterium TaxID=2856 RepID=A0AAD2G5B6_9STRA|nr:unnamed protein product [Cylindrotheca closterium]
MRHFLLFFVFCTFTTIANAANLRGNGQQKRVSSDLSLPTIINEESTRTTISESSPSDDDSKDSAAAALDSVHKILDKAKNTGMTGNSRKVSTASLPTATSNSRRRAPSSPSATTLTENSRKQSFMSAPAPTLATFLPLL